MRDFEGDVGGSVRRSAASWWLVCALGALGATAEPSPTVSVEDGELVAADVVAGSTVAFVGVDRGNHAGFPFELNDAGVAVDEDGDGAVRFDPSIDASATSLWVGVSQGGAVLPASGPSLVAMDRRFAPAIEVDDTGRSLRLRVAGRRYQVLVVRPGEDGGAWTSTLSNGGGGDADGTNDAWLSIEGRSVLSLLEADRGAPLEALEEGDVVVLMAPDRLLWSAFEITADEPSVGGRVLAREVR